MSKVTLVNRTRRPARMLVLNLEPEIKSVAITSRTIEETPSGETGVRVTRRQVGDSIRIQANGSLVVDESFVKSRAVQRAIAAGDLAVIATPTQAEPPAAPVEPSKASEKPSEIQVENQPRTRRRGRGKK